jgi:hypothetical protein
MTGIQPEAIEQLRHQIEIIQKYSDEVDASQGLVANAITQLASAQYAQAIANSLNQIGMSLNLILQRLPEEKPAIIIPR